MDDAHAAMLTAAREGLRRARAAHADVFVHECDRGLARFSRGVLDQHVELEERRAVVRVAVREGSGWRLASVTTRGTDTEAIARAAQKAESIARVTPALDRWPGFASRDERAPRARPRGASMMDAAGRARAVAEVLAVCRDRALLAAGAFESSEHRTAYVNTEGLERVETTPFATCKVFALDGDGVSGFAQKTTRDAAAIDAAIVARSAADKCAWGRAPVVLGPGEYDVVLEAPAVVELLEWLAFTTFGAQSLDDQRSALAGRIGERVTGERVTIVDDGEGEEAFVPGFDREGTARSRVVLIEGGVARGVVFDRLFAARMGSRSTGHAAPPSAWDDAPVPQALVMHGGRDTLESLVAKVDRGLWITRFHYVNGLLDPRRTLMTGLTRDGTFVIERGERGRGVRNMRFTDSVFEALARCEGMSSALEAVPTWWSDGGAFVAPAVLIRGLKFSGGGVEPPAS